MSKQAVVEALAGLSVSGFLVALGSAFCLWAAIEPSRRNIALLIAACVLVGLPSTVVVM